jgi:hypothetical protein
MAQETSGCVMGFNIPTLGEMQSQRRAKQKSELPSKLDKRKQDDRIDHALLDKWRREVHTREGNKCRYSKVKVERTLRLQPNRCECHHVEPRSNKVTRYDRRNGLQLAYVIHERIERGDLKLVGSRFFTADDGKDYLNADFPIFVLVWRERDHRTHGWVFDRVI